MALVVLALVTMTVGWNLRRMSVYGSSVDLRVDGYEEHHEQLGIRDLTSVWLNLLERANFDSERMLEMARTPSRDFEVSLPGGTVLELWLTDGHARYLANLSLAEDAGHVEEMLRVLSRLPADRPDLVRTSGPPGLSIRNADGTLLHALAGGDASLLAALRALRDRPDMARSRINNVLNEMNVDASAVPPTVQRLVFEPTLWAVDVRATDAGAGGDASRADRRWYRVLVGVGDDVPKIHEWRRLTEREFRLARGERFSTQPGGGR
jgi:hypothetical protein